MDSFLLIVVHVCFVILSCLFFTNLWSPAGKGLTSCSHVLDVFFCFNHFPISCYGSGVVLDLSKFDICLFTYSLCFASK